MLEPGRPPVVDVVEEDVDEGGANVVQAPATTDDSDPYDDEATSAAAFYGDAATAAAAASAPNAAYNAAHMASLLEVRTRQLRALQQDYLRLHEHTLQQAQLNAEQQNAAELKVQRAEAEREKMREQLQAFRSRAGEAKPMVVTALNGCEKMLARLAAVRSVDQLPAEMAAASAMLFEARTSLLQAESALREPEAPLPPKDGQGVRSKFNEADLNNDRRLDKREFRLLLKKEFGAADAKQADALFDSIDKDGSGDIDYKEFKKAVGQGRLGAISAKDFSGGGAVGSSGANARKGVGTTGPPSRLPAPGGRGAPAGSSRLPAPAATRRVAGGASDPARGRSAGRGNRLPSVKPPPGKVGTAAISVAADVPPRPIHTLPPSVEQHATPAPLPAGAALHAASALPVSFQQLHPAYYQQMAQQYQQMQQAQMQHALAQQQQQPIPGFGMGLPVWSQTSHQNQSSH